MDDSPGVATRCPDRAVMDLEFGQRLAALKAEVPDREVAGDRIGERGGEEGQGEEERRDCKGLLHERGIAPDHRAPKTGHRSYATSQRRARRRAAAKRTTEPASRAATWGQRFTIGSSRQKTFMKPSMAQAFNVTSPTFWIVSESR